MREATRPFTTLAFMTARSLLWLWVVVVVCDADDDVDDDDDLLCAQCFLKQTKLTTKQ